MYAGFLSGKFYYTHQPEMPGAESDVFVFFKPKCKSLLQNPAGFLYEHDESLDFDL